MFPRWLRVRGFLPVGIKNLNANFGSRSKRGKSIMFYGTAESLQAVLPRDRFPDRLTQNLGFAGSR